MTTAGRDFVCMKPLISIAAMAGLMEAITAAGKNPDQIRHALGWIALFLKILTDSSPVSFSLSYSKKQDGKRSMIASDYTLVNASRQSPLHPNNHRQRENQPSICAIFCVFFSFD